jgi:paraquat-inducible protein B
LNEQGLPAKLAAALANVNVAVSELRAILKEVDRQRLPARVAVALDALTKSIAKVHAVLEGVDGDDGLLASTRRATDAFGDLGTEAVGSTGELEHTLRDVGEAAQAIRDLAQTLERDPDMLLKGRSTEGNP